MKIIGLAGPAGSGKSTVAAYLCNHPDFKFQEISFAEPIKRCLSAMLELPYKYFDDCELKECVISRLGKSPRQLMQTLGTEWGREMVHPNIWTDLAQRKIDYVRDHYPNTNIVVSDVRFESELDNLRRKAAVIWRLIPGPDRVSKSVYRHKSETPINPSVCDRALSNFGTIAELHAKVDRYLREI